MKAPASVVNGPCRRNVSGCPFHLRTIVTVIMTGNSKQNQTNTTMSEGSNLPRRRLDILVNPCQSEAAPRSTQKAVVCYHACHVDWVICQLYPTKRISTQRAAPRSEILRTIRDSVRNTQSLYRTKCGYCPGIYQWEETAVQQHSNKAR